MTRQYRKRIVLDGEFDADAVARIRAFVRTKMRVTCEMVKIELDEAVVEERSLELALAELAPGDDLRRLSVAFFTRRRDELAVAVSWPRPGDGYVEVVGTEDTRVFGIAAALEKHLARWPSGSLRPDGARAGRPGRLERWANDVSVNVVATVAAAGVLGLLGAVWALLT